MFLSFRIILKGHNSIPPFLVTILSTSNTSMEIARVFTTKNHLSSEIITTIKKLLTNNKLQALSLYHWIMTFWVCLFKSQTCVEKFPSNKSLHLTNCNLVLKSIRYNSLRKNCSNLSCAKTKNCRSLLRLIIHGVMDWYGVINIL